MVDANAFVWDSAEDRVVCRCGDAKSSTSVKTPGRDVDLQALHRDLRLQLERALATSMRAAHER